MLHSRLVAPIVLARVHNATRLLHTELYTIGNTLIGLFLCKRYRTPNKLTIGQSRGYATENILEILFSARIDILQRTARRASAGIDSQREIRGLTVKLPDELGSCGARRPKLTKKLRCPGQTSPFSPGVSTMHNLLNTL